MSVKDVTKLPTAGIQLDYDVSALSGNTTTMYVGFDNGRVKSLTTSGVYAELTTKVKLPGKIISIVYTGVSGYAIAAALEDGHIYTFGTDGSALGLFKDLNMGIAKMYYYSNYLYVILKTTQQEKSNLIKIQMA